MTTPSTPWAIADSRLADCVAESFWPSCTISSMSSSAAFSSAMFTMWTKKGKLSPGTEKTIWSCSSCRAAAGAPARGTLANRPNSRVTTSRRVVIRCPRIVVSSASALAVHAGAHRRPRVTGSAGNRPRRNARRRLHPWATLPCTTARPHQRRRSSASPPFSFVIVSPRVPMGTIGCNSLGQLLAARRESRLWHATGRVLAGDA